MRTTLVLERRDIVALKKAHVALTAMLVSLNGNEPATERVHRPRRRRRARVADEPRPRRRRKTYDPSTIGTQPV